MMFASIPKSEGAVDISSIMLSNAPGDKGERVSFDALKGRKISDMGFT